MLFFIQIYDAIHTTVQIEPYKIALNDTAHFQRNITLTIRNRSPNADTFQLTHLPATSIEGTHISIVINVIFVLHRVQVIERNDT